MGCSVSALLSQLMRFAQGNEPWCAIPFSLKIKKTVWSVATDGYVMLAIKLPGASSRKDWPKRIPSLLTDAAVDPVELDLVQLKAWAGDPPSALVPRGDVSHDQQVVLLGQIVDRRKLAYLFARLSLPKVNAWVFEPGLLAFEPAQRQWRGFLACLDGDPDGDEPVFDPAAGPTPAKSVFELAEEAGTE